MRQSFIYSAVLAASSALAAPVAQATTSFNTTSTTSTTLDQSVGVVLDGVLDAEFSVVNENRISTGAQNRGPVSSLEIVVGADALNQDIRCQVFDAAGLSIPARRNANFDVSFSDGDGGLWFFNPPAEIDVIACVPGLVGKGFDVLVTLGSDIVEDSLTTIVNVDKRTVAAPASSNGPFNTFLLEEGVNNAALRCQINDINGQPIFGTRGTNRDTTFSGGPNGAWALESGDVNVGEIICDPAFVADNRAL